MDEGINQGDVLLAFLHRSTIPAMLMQLKAERRQQVGNATVAGFLTSTEASLGFMDARRGSL
jgi:hypothetical protein